MRLISFLKRRESVLPLMILAILTFGVFDAATTIYTAHAIQRWGIPDPYEYELSPLITSGMFGTGDMSVILTKVFILITCLSILWCIAMPEPRLIKSVNLMLLGSIVAGLLAGFSNLFIAFTGETIRIFGVSSAIITLMVASSFWTYGLVAAWRSTRRSTATETPT